MHEKSKHAFEFEATELIQLVVIMIQPSEIQYYNTVMPQVWHKSNFNSLAPGRCHSSSVHFKDFIVGGI